MAVGSTYDNEWILPSQIDLALTPICRIFLLCTPRLRERLCGRTKTATASLGVCLHPRRDRAPHLGLVYTINSLVHYQYRYRSHVDNLLPIKLYPRAAGGSRTKRRLNAFVQVLHGCTRRLSLCSQTRSSLSVCKRSDCPIPKASLF